MSAIDLVVTDLDGTLWDAREQIHGDTLGAVAALQRRATPLLVATGRRLRSAATVLARSGLCPPSVVLDGAFGQDLATGRVFHRATVPPDAALAVLAAFARHGLEPCVYVDHPRVDVFVGDAPSTSRGHLDYLRPHLTRDDLGRVCREEAVLAIGLSHGDVATLAAVLRDAVAHAAGTVTRDLLHGGGMLVVRPAEVSKWAGVQAWCADQGLDPSRVLAVGDGENDVELLTGAAVSCVVRDGSEAALALADHVIEPASVGGWRAVVDLLE